MILQRKEARWVRWAAPTPSSIPSVHCPIQRTVHRDWTDGSSIEIWHSHRLGVTSARPLRQSGLERPKSQRKGNFLHKSAQLVLLRCLLNLKLQRTERFKNNFWAWIQHLILCFAHCKYWQSKYLVKNQKTWPSTLTFLLLLESI